MPDLLVKLYDLPDSQLSVPNGISLRPVMAAETGIACDWVSNTFSRGWGDEFKRGAIASPVSSIIAVKERKIVGFACYDVTALGLFGPTGVDKTCRGQGLGTVLLFAALNAMRAKGLEYAIIGWAGPVEFYARTVGATVIEGSEKRYTGVLLTE